jgi:hypothetical protein
VSDFPPRVESLRMMIASALPEADFLIEEIWKSYKTTPHESGYTAERFWRVRIQAGNRLPTIIDVPDKVVLESTKFATKLVLASPNLIVTPKRPRKI